MLPDFGVIRAGISMDKRFDINSSFLLDNHIDDLINSFANVCELYSVVLDINGHILIDPNGPSTFLGEFHELMLNPKYSKVYADAMNCIIDSKQAIYSEIDDGNPDSRLAAAPIFIDGRFYATWILYAHTKAQNQKLFKAFNNMSTFAEVLSGIVTKLYDCSMLFEKEEDIETKLEFERKVKEIMSRILEYVAIGDKGDASDIYDSVGEVLDVDYMVYYKVDRDRPGYMQLVDYWAKQGKCKEAEDAFSWDSDHYDVEIQEKIKRDGLIIDKNNMTNRMRVEVFNGNAKAIMVFPVFFHDKYQGRLIFIENTKERVWSNSEITFAKDIADMISKDITIESRFRRGKKSNKALIEIFDALPIYTFVRNVDDGKIIYANPAFQNKLGSGIIGQNSFQMIPYFMEEYDNANMAEGISHSYTNPYTKGKYKRYIEQLGGTFDVLEYFMRWDDGQRVSVIVLVDDQQ